MDNYKGYKRLRNRPPRSNKESDESKSNPGFVPVPVVRSSGFNRRYPLNNQQARVRSRRTVRSHFPTDQPQPISSWVDPNTVEDDVSLPPINPSDLEMNDETKEYHADEFYEQYGTVPTIDESNDPNLDNPYQQLAGVNTDNPYREPIRENILNLARGTGTRTGIGMETGTGVISTLSPLSPLLPAQLRNRRGSRHHRLAGHTHHLSHSHSHPTSGENENGNGNRNGNSNNQSRLHDIAMLSHSHSQRRRRGVDVNRPVTPPGLVVSRRGYRNRGMMTRHEFPPQRVVELYRNRNRNRSISPSPIQRAENKDQVSNRINNFSSWNWTSLEETKTSSVGALNINPVGNSLGNLPNDINVSVSVYYPDTDDEVKINEPATDMESDEESIERPVERLSGPTNFVCGLCDQQFSDQISINDHFLLAHGQGSFVPPNADPPSSIFGRFRCPSCPQRFMTEQFLNIHFDNQHLGYTDMLSIDKVSYGFPGFDLLELVGMVDRKIMDNDNDEICYICNEKHIRKVNNEDTFPLKMRCCNKLICSYCCKRIIESSNRIVCAFCTHDHETNGKDLDYYRILVPGGETNDSWVEWWDNHPEINHYLNPDNADPSLLELETETDADYVLDI